MQVLTATTPAITCQLCKGEKPLSSVSPLSRHVSQMSEQAHPCNVQRSPGLELEQRQRVLGQESR